MEGGEISDQYFTFEGRLASFQSAQPVSRRKSNAKGRAPKPLAWPHKQLDPTALARAGFYFEPTPEFPDNAICFLCQKRVGGWEDGDDPIEEHLRLSGHCGWAIVAAIESGLGDYSIDDPSLPSMMEARKATFGGRWPHEGKRGWKCKTKQMVDAGWKYTPTLDSDDMATCTYCQLALDGWEPADKPMNEHYKRSPDCPFFTLINQYQQGPTKKAGKGKGARTSKASRLSVQSVATFASDATSILEQPAEHEDSIMTTTSVMTAGGTKRGKAKKATTAKAKKTRGKKDEPVEVLEDPPEEELPPPPPPKPTRGRKRASDAVEDTALTNAEAPAAKKRATRVRRSNTVDTTVIEPEQDQEMIDAVPAPAAKAARKKSTASSVRNTRKVSTASTASLHHASNDILDDEEIDRQLQADLDRPLTDDEMMVGDSDSERKKAPAKGKGKKATAKKNAEPPQDQSTEDHAMFDPAPVEIDDADVSAELKELQEKMEAEEAEALQVPKKGRKAGTRKVSKQTKAQKAQEKSAEMQAQAEPEAEPVAAVEDDLAKADAAEDHDASMASNATVLKNSTMSAAAPKKRGRPKKNSTQSQPQPAAVEAQPEAPPRPAQASFTESVHKSSTSRATVAAMQPKQRALPQPPATEDELQAPATPSAAKPSASVVKRAVPSPSRSPQSSDAENQPPSSKPSNTASSTRVALAPVAATPMRASPSKRNVNFLSGLQSNQPWTAVDLDLVFEELGKENVMLAPALPTGVQLTSPEKKMTVEEWIYHNACLAEQRLKGQCEATVSKFESEGGRAMRVLEELVID